MNADLQILILVAVAVTLVGAGRLWQRRARSRLLRGTRPEFGGGRETPDDGHFDRLEKLMRERQLFRDPDLDVVSVGSALGLSRRQVKELIARCRGGSFHDYVNDYRVEAARELLSSTDEARATVNAIGRRSGFRTRSSFYRAFRRRMGNNPGAYRRRNRP